MRLCEMIFNKHIMNNSVFRWDEMKKYIICDSQKAQVPILLFV